MMIFRRTIVAETRSRDSTRALPSLPPLSLPLFCSLSCLRAYSTFLSSFRSVFLALSRNFPPACRILSPSPIHCFLPSVSVFLFLHMQCILLFPLRFILLSAQFLSPSIRKLLSSPSRCFSLTFPPFSLSFAPFSRSHGLSVSSSSGSLCPPFAQISSQVVERSPLLVHAHFIVSPLQLSLPSFTFYPQLVDARGKDSPGVTYFAEIDRSIIR